MKQKREKPNVTGPSGSVPYVIGPGIDQSKLAKVASHIINLLYAMIADQVTLLAIFLLNFWAEVCSSEGSNFAKKLRYFLKLLVLLEKKNILGYHTSLRPYQIKL